MAERRFFGHEHGSAAAGLVTTLCALLTPGCLVTDQLEFGEPNVPANLRAVSPASLSRLPPKELADPECGESAVAFQVQVSDANVEDSLQARLFINGSLNTGFEREIPSTGEVLRAPLTLCAKRANLSTICNRVELVVTNRFLNDDNPYGVDDPEDLARIEWWVLAPASEAADVQLSDCISLLQTGDTP